MQRARQIFLRRWQQEALLRFEKSSQQDFLAVATPGAGKTTFALAACVRSLQGRHARRVVVVTPTQHLKHQWADAAEQLGLALEPEWTREDGALPSDLHGLVTTYQQIAAGPRALRPIARKAFVILDEVHHAAESRAWGDGIRLAFAEATRRLSLSGTPFRTDQNPIPFVRYTGDRAQPDFEYGYVQALGDRNVVRPVYFPRFGGRMDWSGQDGTAYSHDFDDRLAGALASERLRTALSVEQEWLPAVLTQANDRLRALRERDQRAGGMVIAMDQTHARAIARLMRTRLGVRPALATSDDPQASAKIADFAAGDTPWIVAVRMVSEGVDIPRLRVGVYATHTVTELFFRQAVGRLVRFSGNDADQAAYVFIPDDPRIRRFAEEIQKERRHNLARRDPVDDDGAGDPTPEPDAKERTPEQLSLFAAIKAVATPKDVLPAPRGEPLSDAPAQSESGTSADATSPLALELPLLAPPPPRDPDPSHPEMPQGPETPRSPEPDPAPMQISPLSSGNGGPPRDRRRQLRALNTQRAQQVARRAGLSHAAVNAELNRSAGIRRIAEATASQLARRLAAADAWLRKL